MVSIITPTFNRAYILDKAYESLKRQTSKNFEWIIIDDGSLDNTEELVNVWKNQENSFEITYFHQENGGKHRALNKGISLVKYDYVLILDSDDFLTDDAVEFIHKCIEEMQNEDGFAGFSGLKNLGGKTVSSSFKDEYIDCTNLERIKYGLNVDMAEVYKTEILRQYPFPEFEEEKFCSESAVWDKIAKDGYKIRWFNKVICNAEYIEDGLTRNLNEEFLAKNFLGFCHCTELFLKTRKGTQLLNRYGLFYKVAKLKGYSLRESAKLIKVPTFKMWMGVCYFKLRKLGKRILRGKN
ncbi:MAG: glycosyltransferase family 2 protein [Clostridia bacterium]|nr:glycosyltransferase family 2 protein [Clostridia bacterium]